MEKRTTVLLDREVYEALVKESMEEYNTTKAISKVLNEILKKTLKNKGKLSKLLHSKKVATITAREFEEFRESISNVV